MTFTHTHTYSFHCKIMKQMPHHCQRQMWSTDQLSQHQEIGRSSKLLISIRNKYCQPQQTLSCAPVHAAAQWQIQHHLFTMTTATIEVLIKLLDSGLIAFSIHMNVIKITIPKNGGDFKRQPAIGQRNTPLLLLLVCVSFTIIGQPRNSVLIRRV